MTQTPQFQVPLVGIDLILRLLFPAMLKDIKKKLFPN